MTLPSFSLSSDVVSRRRLVFLCAIMLAVAVTLLLGWAKHQGLFAVPAKNNQHFTELYFTDTKAIPLHLESDRRYSIPFAIVNRESNERTYTYRTHVSEGDQTITESQSVTLARGERAIRTVRFSPRDATQPLKVSIELASKQQTITFRIPQ